jgi:hypothetical protein
MRDAWAEQDPADGRRLRPGTAMARISGMEQPWRVMTMSLRHSDPGSQDSAAASGAVHPAQNARGAGDHDLLS